MSATRNNRNAVLEMIGAMTATCAPVKITVGRKFDDHFVLIHDAPASVVSRIVRECVFVSMTADGLHIPTEG